MKATFFAFERKQADNLDDGAGNQGFNFYIMEKKRNASDVENGKETKGSKKRTEIDTVWRTCARKSADHNRNPSG